jgi:hypothetical protein
MLPAGISGVVPVGQMVGDDQEDTDLLAASLAQAKNFLLSRKWCLGIGEMYFGAGLGGVVSVFLASIDPVPKGVDEWLWVIVGDIPPAYLVLDDCLTPFVALETYIELMQDWIDLARDGITSPEVIPLDVSATPENAELLQRRMDSLRNTVVPCLEAGPTIQK